MSWQDWDRRRRITLAVVGWITLSAAVVVGVWLLICLLVVIFR